VSSSAHITAGLPAEDVLRGQQTALVAKITAGLPASEIDSGHRLYIGNGGLDSVDFSVIQATAVPVASGMALAGYGLAASSRYTLVVRPVLNGLETPDLSNAVEFETDADGNWLGNRPVPVERVTAEAKAGGQVMVSWTYWTPDGLVVPHGFGVYYDTDPEITVGSPNATEDYTRDGRYSHTFTLIDGQTYFFAVTARTEGGLESRLSGIAGPVIADATGPSQPQVIVTRAF